MNDEEKLCPLCRGPLTWGVVDIPDMSPWAPAKDCIRQVAAHCNEGCGAHIRILAHDSNFAKHRPDLKTSEEWKAIDSD